MDDNIISIAKLNNGAKQNHLTSLFQGLENILTDKSKFYQDKVQALLTVWQQLVNFVSETSKESPQAYFDSLFLNTLRFVLRADWPKIGTATKTHLSVTLQRLITVLKKCGTYHSILEQCKILESIVKDPWGQSALSKILRTNHVDLKECVEYFKLENPKVVVVRLEMLLLSKCEDFAINLCKACLDTYSSLEVTLDFNQNEIDYITDIYFSSLMKNKRKLDLIAEIKKYPLDEGLSLLQRYRRDTVGGNFKENCKVARVWKCNEKLIEQLSNTLLANAVLHEGLLESQSQLEALIAEWAAVMTVNGELSPDALQMIRKFVLIAQSSTCIYPFCSFLIRNGNCKEQDFTMVAKCLIRAINQNMNEVEQHRVNRERDKLKETYGQLSKGFLLLSDLLNECQNIYKECLLTSFSLSPSRECLRIIEAFITKLANVTDLPEESKLEENQKEEATQSTDSPGVELEKPTSGVEVTVSSETTSQQPESVCTASETTLSSKPPPETTSDTLNEILESMGVPEKDDNQSCEDLDSKQVNKQIDSEKGLASAYMTELENLSWFDEAMAGDLNTILNYRRYYTLTWDLEWLKLKANCEQYLEDFEKKDFEDVELKYLDLDYNQFKDQPIDNEDLYGIEKGYERYAFSPSESEEEISSTKKSGVSSYESEEDILLIHRKRKKTISSDSDEPRNKKKRGRKPKPKSDEEKRRDSQKSDTGSNPEDDKILDTIESVIAKSTNAENLKELRSYRITSIKSNTDGTSIDDNQDECETIEITKEQEELNNYLADSYKSLESIEMPPLWPRFNIYDIILDNTLVPSDSEIRLPKCEDLSFNNENVFTENITPVEPIKEEEKPHKPIPKEKNRAPRKRPPKVPKPKLTKPIRPNESYLTYSTCPTLLSNDDLFKRKYVSNQKPSEKMVENQNTVAVSPVKDLVVQLPKLSESFSFTQKKSIVMKPIDQNVSFSSYLRDALDDKSSISTSIYEPLNENTKFNTFPPTSVNVGTDTNLSENLEEIENFLKTYQSPNYTPTHAPNTSQCHQQQTTVENTCQTDISAPDIESWQSNYAELEHILNTSSSTNYDSPAFDSPKSSPIHNIYKAIPTTSQLTSFHSNPSNVIPTYTCTARNNNNITIKRTGTDKVDKILHDYQAAITENPALKNVPAPRKRGSSTKTPKKPRSRAKNDPLTVKILKIPKTNGVVSSNETKPSKFSPSPVFQQIDTPMPKGHAAAAANVSYANNAFYNKSSSKLPPIDASSQVVAQSQYQFMVSSADNSKSVPKIKVKVPNGCGTLKALLLKGPPSSTSGRNVSVPVANQTSYTAEITNGQKINPPVTRVNNLGQHISLQKTQMNNLGQQISPQTTQVNNLCQQISPSTTSINDLGQQISPQATHINNVCQQSTIPTTLINNHVSQMHQNDTRMNIASANTTYNSFNSSSQPQKATQYLKGYKGLTNNFEVRIPRIDQRINAINYSTNNVQYSCSNKTMNDTRNSNLHVNIPPVSSNMLPSVVIPMLPTTAIQNLRNNSMVNMPGNYQINNFNVTTTASLPATSTQNVQININSSMPMNNIIGNTSINNPISPDVVFNNTSNIKSNDLKFYGTVDSNNADGPILQVSEGQLPESFIESYWSFIN